MVNIKYAIEGILFAAGEPVKAAKLAVVLDTGVDEIKKAVAELKEEYDENKRGFNIILCIHSGNTGRAEKSAAVKRGNGGACHYSL